MAAGEALVSGPRLTRRQTAGAESAKGLLFTVLGEFVLPSGGAAWTSAFIDALGRLGVEEKACRQALMRTAADGWLTADRAGRRTSWRLTGSGVRLLTEGTERIYGFAAARRAWDGRWLMILVRAPESERPARHRLRTRLSWAGFGSPAPGVWLSPDATLQGEAERILTEAGLRDDAQIFLASHTGGSDLATLARQAWDLDRIEDQYEQFIAEFGAPARTDTAATGRADPLARVIGLVHAWRRFPWLDPVLPAALLPAGWSGTRAAAVFSAQHATWSVAAAAEWRRISGLA